MGDLTEHFSRHEFACNCGCGFDTVDFELLETLEDIRGYYGRPITVHSGCRCLDWNRKCLSKDTSQHVKARAADIEMEIVQPWELYEFLDVYYSDRYGFGLYGSFVHVDTRSGGPARWGT